MERKSQNFNSILVIRALHSTRGVASALLLLIGSACSFAPANQRQITIQVPDRSQVSGRQGLGSGAGQSNLRLPMSSRSDAGHGLANGSGLALASTRDQVHCYGIRVVAPDFTVAQGATRCNDNETLAIYGGLIPLSGGKMSLSVPAGDARKFGLYAFKTGDGSCPSALDYFRTDGSAKQATAFLLSESTVDIRSDLTLSLKADFESSTAQVSISVGCGSTTGTSGTTTVATLSPSELAASVDATRSSISVSSLAGGLAPIANGAQTVTLSISLLNSTGAPVAGLTPTFSATEVSLGRNTLGTCTATNSLGASTCTLASREAGVKSVSLTWPVALAGNSIEFVHGPAGIVKLVSTPSSAGAGSMLSSVSARIYDANDNPVTSGTDASVTLSLSADYGGGAVGVGGTPTAYSSTGAANWSAAVLTIAGPSVRLFANIVGRSGITSIASSTFSVAAAAPSATTSSISGPANIPSGSATAITVYYRDSYGNPVSGQGSTTVSFPGGFTPTSFTCGTSNSSGESVCTGVLTVVTVGAGAYGISTPITENTTSYFYTPIAFSCTYCATPGLRVASANTLTIGAMDGHTGIGSYSVVSGSGSVLQTGVTAVVTAGPSPGPIVVRVVDTGGYSSATLTLNVVRPTKVAMGSSHTCVLFSDSVVKCFGYNGNGQLGVGSTTSFGNATNRVSSAPTVTFPSGFVPIDISAGMTQTCATSSDHRVICWGGNASSQLGFDPAVIGLVNAPSSLNQITFNSLLGSFNGPLSFTSKSSQYSCAMPSASSPKFQCFGGGGYFLGLGATDSIGSGAFPLSSSVPVSLASNAQIKKLTLGSDFACALTSNTNSPGHEDQLSCWGLNSNGQTGYTGGTVMGASVETSHVALTGVAFSVLDVEAGDGHACSIYQVVSSKFVKCWGTQAGTPPNGALGWNTNTVTSFASGPGSVPNVAINGSYKPDHLALGSYHSCVLLENYVTPSDRQVSCWGSDSQGQLGDGSNLAVGNLSSQFNGAFLPLPSGETPQKVFAGGQRTCLLFESGALLCVGANSSGELGQDLGHSSSYLGGGQTSATAPPVHFFNP